MRRSADGTFQRLEGKTQRKVIVVYTSKELKDVRGRCLLFCKRAVVHFADSEGIERQRVTNNCLPFCRTTSTK
jgi:hypothetical protein